MNDSPRVQAVGAFALFLLVSVVLTWPLARLLPIAVAYPGDPLINSWIVSWNSHALVSDARFFDANIFFPARNALAFSENLFGLLPLAAPLSFFVRPLAVHNILLIVGFAFSAFGAFVLGRMVTGSASAGFVAGILYGFCPWRFTHITHLQHAWGGWLPLIVAALVRYDRKRDRRSAAIVAFVVVMNGLTNLHYLVFGLVIAAIVAAVTLVASPELRSWRFVIPLAIALTSATAMLVVVLWPYQMVQRLHSIRGNAAETDQYTAKLSDWRAPEDAGEPERRVFPGYAAVIAGAAGLLAWRDRRSRALIVTSFLLIVFGVVLSMGRTVPPYAWAFDHLPTIRGIRAPARWAVLAYCGLALLSALAIGWRRLRRSRRAALAICVASVAIIEVWHVPFRWYLMPADDEPVYRWLAQNDRPGGILELPIGERDFYYLSGAALHHRPIFNGASGAAPASYTSLVRAFSSPSISEDVLDRVKALGGSTLIVHADALGEHTEEVRRWLTAGLANGSLAYLGHFDAMLTGDYVFGIGGHGKPPDEALRVFLGGAGLPSHRGPFGFVESPPVKAELTGPLTVRGWAVSPAGVRTARLWFANKSCFVDAQFEPFDALRKVLPQYSTDSARFVATLPRRPCGGEDNDVLVELIDHSGRSTTLPHIWFRWSDEMPAQ